MGDVCLLEEKGRAGKKSIQGCFVLVISGWIRSRRRMGPGSGVCEGLLR
jgi:hypothetical protein